MKVGSLVKVYAQYPVVNRVTKKAEIIRKDYIAIIVHIGDRKIEVIAEGNIKSVHRQTIELLV